MSAPRRIYGLETEYGITIVGAHPGTSPTKLTADEAARHLFRSVIAAGRSSNVFLPNGGRLYLDVGSHPEYATAECDLIHDVLVQDRAGEAILNDLATDATAQLEEEGIGGRIHLLKNNLDVEGNSFGCHENYLLRRRPDFAQLVEQVVPFLVTRQILTGAGYIRPAPGGATYCFSQRSEHLWDAMSSATTRSRPMINSRDEPHANPDRYRRLHVIAGDSSVAEPTTFLKLGMTGLLLELLEAGVRFDDLLLIDPMRAIRDVSRDLSATTPLELADGRSRSAIQMQQDYLSRIGEYLSTRETTAAEKRVLDLWQRGLQALEYGDHSLIDTELDWAIKKRLVDGYRQRQGAALDDVRIARLVLAYHDISVRDGLATRLTDHGLMTRLTAPAEVERARNSPPQTTRAKLRGDFIAAARHHRRDHTVDWVNLKLHDARRSTVLCQDPFAATDSRVEALIASMAEQ